ncbi:Glutamine-dependent NAD(+) synthetase [Rubripirellula lacrimiformis]|uniref:Glutamine-dependent NAD(+) synthetase n=2 Tax=Rubripirellula lacrimiformis TaxID=1930273 RepID=A0A517NF69_9BACT|nr:Glutamine-dependent NAD(+) synthetase [Rubripirellula lacrimiformis]
MQNHGFYRVTAAAPAMSVANPAANAAASMQMIDSVDADLVVLPELGLTGYTCGDLFATDALLDAALDGLAEIAAHSSLHRKVVIVGMPLSVGTSLMNVAVVVANGSIEAVIPKSYLPTYREFYEGRHFRGSDETDPPTIEIFGESVPFGTDLLVQHGDARIAVEICEDFWTPIPPSSHAAIAGANVLVNLSASNETIGKAAWRRDLVRSQSGRCIAAYVYASSGPGESTSDLVFGGHCLVAENGGILGESRRVGDGVEPFHFEASSITCDVDLQRLSHDRRVIGSFDDARSDRHLQYRVVAAEFPEVDPDWGPLPRTNLLRPLDAHPFVPDESGELDSRCAEIFSIQTAGLVKRLSRLGSDTKLSIGVSGGLDSTLALLVAIRACDAVGKSRSDIVGMTMPGFGTTDHTRTSADQLIELTDVQLETIDIRRLCLDTFLSLGHSPLGIVIDGETTVDGLQVRLNNVGDDAKDLTFENVQARIRTMLLMSRGFVLGTGDMSEQALGWSTYNADHMSMYNVNTSVPKTLVCFLVRYAAEHFFDGPLRQVLHRIADTPISPELLPPRADGTLRQATEATVGSYELLDFFLYHFVRNGFDQQKILYLASHAKFDQQYAPETIAETLDGFFKRFFFNQFKRNCVPDGPKVGSVSLSPRGDWRMPSDADSDAFRD